ncbi:hypothetical protein [Noviherbaspirillum humi]|uniref:hypothetical protein n=1 Tax=Noviherbaspirillum humi TaxID=1688639 RepID=UPI0011604068|nr:hypothetical protein [Noviherbaspirillum humi]
MKRFIFFSTSAKCDRSEAQSGIKSAETSLEAICGFRRSTRQLWLDLNQCDLLKMNVKAGLGYRRSETILNGCSDAEESQALFQIRLGASGLQRHERCRDQTRLPGNGIFRAVPQALTS